MSARPTPDCGETYQRSVPWRARGSGVGLADEYDDETVELVLSPAQVYALSQAAEEAYKSLTKAPQAQNRADSQVPIAQSHSDSQPASAQPPVETPLPKAALPAEARAPHAPPAVDAPAQNAHAAHARAPSAQPAVDPSPPNASLPADARAPNAHPAVPVPCAAQAAAIAVAPAVGAGPGPRMRSLASADPVATVQPVAGERVPVTSAPQMADGQLKTATSSNVPSGAERHLSKVDAARGMRWPLARIAVVVGITGTLVAFGIMAHRGSQLGPQDSPPATTAYAPAPPSASAKFRPAVAPVAASAASTLQGTSRSVVTSDPVGVSAATATPTATVATASATAPGSLQTAALARSPNAEPAPATASNQSNRPVTVRNPFDSTEVFQFPPGTSAADARAAVAAALLDRARERRAQTRAGNIRSSRHFAGRQLNSRYGTTAKQ